MMKMQNMALSPAEAKEMTGDCCAPSMLGEENKGPKYPYGLTIYLCDDTLAKLNLGDLPDVGTKFTLMALVEVTSNSQRQTQDGKDVSMDLQITDMALSSGPDKTPAQSLYSASNMNP
jgi:hypothetical protein